MCKLNSQNWNRPAGYEPGPLFGASPGFMGGPESDVGVKKQAEPVSAGERFFAVDVLRGFALWASWR